MSKEPETLLRLPEVQKRVPLSKSTIFLKITHGSFPAPVKMGARARGWRESDITAFIDGLSKTSGKGVKA
ncbi:helix-turn-helix transcriptional regulator [Acidipila rosea]|uniref:AlpA family transcriptional regulator n=1 Tax=Acidipila rosea TaxID=768535 RepID=A0A4R1L3A8_9BACT|nr:AlpA family phage regulatory protein [Acidipila rosea]TCK72464.1 AlpA family transcriptional regulator [Acidipila rosea]